MISLGIIIVVLLVLSALYHFLYGDMRISGMLTGAGLSLMLIILLVPAPTKETPTKEELEAPRVIREFDGCKVYEFMAGGRMQYVTRCADIVRTESAGKTGNNSIETKKQ